MGKWIDLWRAAGENVPPIYPAFSALCMTIGGNFAQIRTCVRNRTLLQCGAFLPKKPRFSKRWQVGQAPLRHRADPHPRILTTRATFNRASQSSLSDRSIRGELRRSRNSTMRLLKAKSASRSEAQRVAIAPKSPHASMMKAPKPR